MRTSTQQLWSIQQPGLFGMLRLCVEDSFGPESRSYHDTKSPFVEGTGV